MMIGHTHLHCHKFTMLSSVDTAYIHAAYRR